MPPKTFVKTKSDIIFILEKKLKICNILGEQEYFSYGICGFALRL